VAADHFNLGLEFSADARRHPDGVNARDSVDAIPEGYSSHRASPGAVSFRRVLGGPLLLAQAKKNGGTCRISTDANRERIRKM
jgi:hypothetical protein